MEGITILEKQIAYEFNIVGLYILAFGFGSLLFGVLLSMETSFEKVSIFSTSIGVIAILTAIIMICIPVRSSNKAIYIVKIEKKVDLNEFLDKYEIIEHEKYSNIYKIKGDIINDN